MIKKFILIILSVFCLIGCAPTIEKCTISNSVDIVSTKADMSNYKFLDDNDHSFKKITYKESLRIFEESGSGILFYGYDDCYYCNRAVPILNEVAKEAGIDIYYIDTYDITDTTREDYDALMDYLKPTFREDEETETKEFYVPDVVGVKKGEIIKFHVSLTDDFIAGNENKQLTTAQQNNLKQIYIDIINSIKD